MPQVSYIDNPSLKYPEFPYLPDKKYPELSTKKIDSANDLYAQMRELLRDQQLDEKNFNKPGWNPLGIYIKPNQKILLKPNWVMHKNLSGGSLDCVVTHTSIIKFTIDYVLIALNYRGHVLIADAPLQSCDFDELTRKTRIRDLVQIYQKQFPKVKFSVIDLRKTIYGDGKQAVGKGDVKHGYSLIDLKAESLLEDISDQSQKFRVTMYNPKKLQEHHMSGKHEYLIANALLEADFIINLPKMKTHIKAGLTGAMKNTIGINGHKEYLPHHRYGSTSSGGDQFPGKSPMIDLFNKLADHHWQNVLTNSDQVNKIEKFLLRTITLFLVLTKKDGYLDAGWPGNDTLPRTTVDLNNILQNRYKKLIHIVDGVIAGEGKGPLRPEPLHTGIVLMGDSASAVDLVMAKLIGYDPLQIRTIKHALTHPKSKLKFKVSSLQVIRNSIEVKLNKINSLGFKKPDLWRGI